jgi:hypothetical protein
VLSSGKYYAGAHSRRSRASTARAASPARGEAVRRDGLEETAGFAASTVVAVAGCPVVAVAGCAFTGSV